jgi:hypothetical protein
METKELKRTLKKHGFEISFHKDFMLIYREDIGTHVAPKSNKYARLLMDTTVEDVATGKTFSFPKMTPLQMGVNVYYINVDKRKAIAVVKDALHDCVRPLYIIASMPTELLQFFPITHFNYYEDGIKTL